MCVMHKTYINNVGDISPQLDRPEIYFESYIDSDIFIVEQQMACLEGLWNSSNMNDELYMYLIKGIYTPSPQHISYVISKKA